LNIAFCLSFAIKYLSYKKSCNLNKAKLAPLIAHSVPFSNKYSKALPANSIANGFNQLINISTQIPLAPISPPSAWGVISLSIKSIIFCSSCKLTRLSDFPVSGIGSCLLITNLKASCQVSALAFQISH
jgi:hypothetical protein